MIQMPVFGLMPTTVPLISVDPLHETLAGLARNVFPSTGVAVRVGVGVTGAGVSVAVGVRVAVGVGVELGHGPGTKKHGGGSATVGVTAALVAAASRANEGT